MGPQASTIKTFIQPLFSFTEVVRGSLTTKNIEVSFTKSGTFGSRLSDKSLIYIEKNGQIKRKQEMPSQQQKSAQNGPEMYLLIGLNLILIILKFDD